MKIGIIGNGFVGKATFLLNCDDIEIFNKKAIYLYLREITGLNTKQVVNSLNKFREHYRDFKSDWENGKI